MALPFLFLDATLITDTRQSLSFFQKQRLFVKEIILFINS